MQLPTSPVQQVVSSFALSLCLTYLAHAAIAAAVAALAARSPRLSFTARNCCWKAAIFVPLLSAWCACIGLGAPSVAQQASLPGLARTSSQATAGAVAAAGSWLPHVALSLPSTRPSATGLAWLVALAGGLGLLRFAASATALRYRLQGRKGVTDPRLLRRFEQLRIRIGRGNVRLTECQNLPAPLVVGTREVCIPLGVLTSFSNEDMDAVLAHELAHIERKDGVWFPLVGAVQYLLWFQPLNQLVSSRFRQSAELACDDRAVELTGSPRALGRAIVRLAEAAAQRPGSKLAPAIACRESDLRSRVQRLVTLSGLHGVHPGQRSNGVALAGVALVGIALLMLSVRVVRAEHAPSPLMRATRAAPVASDSAPSSVAAYNARMGELALRAQQLTAALAELSEDPAAAHEGTPGFTRGLELGQELRHIRGTQAWLEERFIAASSLDEQN